MKLAELFDVTDLVTVVTGGASGIGCAYAEAMADNGARGCDVGTSARPSAR